MADVKFKLNTKGVRTEILQADWMASYIGQVAVRQSDPDSHVRQFIGFDRAKAIIYPNTEEHSG